jgi:hypothetical protein
MSFPACPMCGNRYWALRDSARETDFLVGTGGIVELGTGSGGDADPVFCGTCRFTAAGALREAVRGWAAGAPTLGFSQAADALVGASIQAESEWNEARVRA